MQPENTAISRLRNEIKRLRGRALTLPSHDDAVLVLRGIKADILRREEEEREEVERKKKEDVKIQEEKIAKNVEELGRAFGMKRNSPTAYPAVDPIAVTNSIITAYLSTVFFTDLTTINIRGKISEEDT